MNNYNFINSIDVMNLKDFAIIMSKHGDKLVQASKENRRLALVIKRKLQLLKEHEGLASIYLELIA